MSVSLLGVEGSEGKGWEGKGDGEEGKVYRKRRREGGKGDERVQDMTAVEEDRNG